MQRIREKSVSVPHPRRILTGMETVRTDRTLVFPPNQRRPCEAASIAHRGLCVVVGGPLTLGRHRRLASESPQTSLTSDALFQLTKVWTVHLTLSREAWDALTPVAPPAIPPAPAPPPPPGPATAPTAQAPPALHGRAAAAVRGGIPRPRGQAQRPRLRRRHRVQLRQGRPGIRRPAAEDVAVRYKGNGTWMQSQGSPKRR